MNKNTNLSKLKYKYKYSINFSVKNAIQIRHVAWTDYWYKVRLSNKMNKN